MNVPVTELERYINGPERLRALVKYRAEQMRAMTQAQRREFVKRFAKAKS